MTCPPPNPAHIRALDGIRGVAVVFVIWFHFRRSELPGGWIGMSIFFPLSGFLITRQLVIERLRSGRISVSRFWVRRARRLLPALYVVLALVGLIVLVGDRPAGGLVGDSVSSLLYVNNWWQLRHTVAYWQQFSGRASPLEHLWSLSVEEQFYIVWPIVVIGVLRIFRGSLAALKVVLACGCLAGAFYGVILSRHGGADITPVYYNTFVRTAELAAGSLLAVIMVTRKRRSPSTTRARLGLEIIAVGCLIALTFLALTLDRGTTGFVSNGGMFAAGLATCVLIAAAHQNGPVARTLSRAPLAWSGTRCYSLYLWHWPVFVFMTHRDTGLTGWWLTAVQVIVTVSAAVLSYWLIELPFRSRSIRIERSVRGPAVVV